MVDPTAGPGEELSNPLLDDAELTFCLIKPMAVYAGVDREIRTFLERNRFVTLAQQRLMLTDEITLELLKGEPCGETLLGGFRGAAVLYELTRRDAVSVLRKLAGDDDPERASAGTLHYMFGVNWAHNGVLVPKNRAEFERQFEVLQTWFQVYTRAIAEGEAEPLARADETFRKLMGLNEEGIQGGDEQESPDDEGNSEVPAAPSTQERTNDAIIEKVASHVADGSGGDERLLATE